MYYCPPQAMDLISYLKQSNWLNIDINTDLQFNIKRQSNAILYIIKGIQYRKQVYSEESSMYGMMFEHKLFIVCK